MRVGRASQTRCYGGLGQSYLVESPGSNSTVKETASIFDQATDFDETYRNYAKQRARIAVSANFESSFR